MGEGAKGPLIAGSSASDQNNDAIIRNADGGEDERLVAPDRIKPGRDQ